MSYQDGIPDTILEQVIMVEGILSEVATGGSRDNPNNNIYIILRREFMSDSFNIRTTAPICSLISNPWRLLAIHTE